MRSLWITTRMCPSNLLRGMVGLLGLVLLPLVSGCNCGCVDEDEDTHCEGEADCNDADASVHVEGIEQCNGVDEDCDSLIDEGFDRDGDGHYDQASCASVGGTDCDDENAEVNPDAAEQCDAIDWNCDSDPTDGFKGVTFCADVDGDTFGDPNSTTINCDQTAPAGYVACATDPLLADCDDLNPAINPNGVEVCDAADQDCDGIADNGFDADGDLYLDGNNAGCANSYDPATLDCNDADDTINPEGVEVCDAVDQDCDGTNDNGFDSDSDTFLDGADAGCAAAYATSVLDCDDSRPDRNPDATEVCDNFDTDCDGTTDEGFDGDGDGYLDGNDLGCAAAYAASELDCDDSTTDNAPGATELCDGIDNDCDGFTTSSSSGDDDDSGGDDDDSSSGDDDDSAGGGGSGGIPAVELDGDEDGYVACTPWIGTDLAIVGGNDCEPEEATANPGETTEICDGLDNDCDGTADNSFADGDSDGSASCVDCDDGDPTRSPNQSESCDGIDNDCDTNVPSNEVDGDGDLYLPCTGFVQNGVGLVGGDDCEDDTGTVPNAASINPGATEVCDGVDNDCNSDVDGEFDVDDDGYFDDSISGCVTAYSASGLLDCYDNVAALNPGAPEVCDLVDNDCDNDIDTADTNASNGTAVYVGTADFDNDGDLGPGICGGDDCDELDPAMNGLDVDEDGADLCGEDDDPAPDGTEDCNDADPYVNPSAPETCDGVDTDCDGLIDTADGSLTADADNDTFDSDGCSFGGTDCDDRDRHVFPTVVVTSGYERQCQPAVYPGFNIANQFNPGRAQAPSYYFDANTSTHYLFFVAGFDNSTQGFGYASSTDGVTWGSPQGPLLLPVAASWDDNLMYNPAVAEFSGQARPFALFYQAQDSANAKTISLATATAITGPYERKDLDGVVLTAAAFPPSSDSSFPDSSKVLQPAVYYDGADLNLFYVGKGSNSCIFLAQCSSGCGTNSDWTRFDGADSDSAPDPLACGSELSWEIGNVGHASLVLDPTGTALFETMYNSGSQFGAATSAGVDAVWVKTAQTAAAFAVDASDPVTRFDGGWVYSPAFRYDTTDDAYYMYYEGAVAANDLPGDPDENIFYGNPDFKVSYIGVAVNWAPQVTIDAPASPSTTMTLTGTLNDSLPTGVDLALSSDVDGALGSATISPPTGSGPGRQATTWSAGVTFSTSGTTHTVTATATDEGGIQRSETLSVAIP